MMKFKSYLVAGVKVNLLTPNDIFGIMEKTISSHEKIIIANHNLHSIYLYHKDIVMYDFCNKASYVFIDGMPIIWFGRLLGLPFQKNHRITPLDWVEDLMKKTSAANWRIMFVGAKPGVGEKAMQFFKDKYPSLQYRTLHGYFDRSPESEENKKVLNSINEYKPNILLVGMGMPIQEAWVMDNFSKISANSILNVGALMDYIAGEVPIPPRWLSKLGLEGFYRLICEPGRLWKRYLLEPWFILRQIIRELLLKYFSKKGKNKKYGLVVGFGNQTEAIAQYFANNPQQGVKVIGYVSDIKDTAELEYLGDFSKLEEVFSSRVVDTVVISLSLSDFHFRNCLAVSAREGKEIKIVLTELGELTDFSKSVSIILGTPAITFAKIRANSVQQIAKRTFDLVTSALGLLILSPFLFLVALLIKLESPEGPVFFKQNRTGLNGRIFEVYKFRSMIPEAEKLQELLLDSNEMSGPVFKMKKDPRITKVGKFIRKTSIDELPQLINILKGDMSLVGPRPLPIEEIARFDNAAYRRRLSVKPGLTCIWQISGRNNVDFEEWMKLDMKYIDSWSLWLDLKILCLTIPVVMFGKGAS